MIKKTKTQNLNQGFKGFIFPELPPTFVTQIYPLNSQMFKIKICQRHRTLGITVEHTSLYFPEKTKRLPAASHNSPGKSWWGSVAIRGSTRVHFCGTREERKDARYIQRIFWYIFEYIYLLPLATGYPTSTCCICGLPSLVWLMG
jgi:hypothetical protein